jgi:tyrosine-protein phosphatase YwqE
MFSFFHRKQKEIFPFHQLITDVHSHLLPGIDDGSPDLTTSIYLLKGMVDLGFQHFTATPHVMQDIWKNTNESIDQAYSLLKTALDENKINYPLVAAAEYMVDENLESLLKNKTPLRTIRNNWVLIEISFLQPPLQLNNILFEMQLQGYQPILAHPERYLYYANNVSELVKLKDMGCILQSNLLSFSGYYGKEVLRFAERLVDQKLINLLGTDLHHQRHLEGLKNLNYSKSLQKLMSVIEN